MSDRLKNARVNIDLTNDGSSQPMGNAGAGSSGGKLLDDEKDGYDGEAERLAWQQRNEENAKKLEAGGMLRVGEDVKNLEVCSYGALKDYCGANGLSKTGTKQMLIDRLKALFKPQVPKPQVPGKEKEEEEDERDPVDSGVASAVSKRGLDDRVEEQTEPQKRPKGATTRPGEDVANLEEVAYWTLKEFCGANGLAKAGTKQMLIDRLKAFFKPQLPGNDKEEEGGEMRPVDPVDLGAGNKGSEGEGDKEAEEARQKEVPNPNAKLNENVDEKSKAQNDDIEAQKEAYVVKGSAESVGIGDRVIVGWDSRLLVMTVVSVPVNDESGLYECKYLQQGLENVFVSESYLLLCPKKPMFLSYNANHFVLYCNGNELVLGQLLGSCSLAIDADGVRVKKSTLHGKTNFVNILDVNTHSSLQRRPSDVVFDLMSDGKVIAEEDFYDSSLTFLGVEFAFKAPSDAK